MASPRYSTKEMLSLLGLVGGVYAANNLYCRWVTRRQKRKSSRYTQLRNILAAAGVNIDDTTLRVNVGTHPFTGKRLVAKVAPFYATDSVGGVKEDTVYIGNARRPGILAHEAGHAKSGLNKSTLRKLLYRISLGSTTALGAANVGLALAGGKRVPTKVLRNIGIASAVAATPVLAEELAASTIGRGILSSTSDGKESGVGAYVGVPTYAALAGIGMIPYLHRKFFVKD